MSAAAVAGRMPVRLAAGALAVLGACLAAGGATAPGWPDALRRAGERAAMIEDRFERTWAWYAVAEETCATDPAAAAELSEKLESWTAKRDLLGVVMYAWAKADPNAAARWGLEFQRRTEGRPADRNVALHHAVVGMVCRAPKLAEELIWKHLQEEGWGGRPRTAPRDAARELARTDPPAALALAGKIQLEPFRVDALRGVAREWARSDPQAALAALSARTEARLGAMLPRDIAEGWAHKDPRAAAEYAKGLPEQDRTVKLMALVLVAGELARTDAPAAAELCRQAAPLNLGKWHEQDPRARLAVAGVAEAFAAADPQAAVRWAESLPDGPGGFRRGACDGVAAGWAARDAQAALAFYRPKTSEKGPAENVGTGAAWPALARALARTDPAAAQALAVDADSLVLKSNVIHEVAVEVARVDPPAAAEIVSNWAGVTDYYTYRAGAARVVAAAWAKKAPQAAAAWAEKLTPETDRHAALKGVAAAWAKADPAGAGAWAGGLKDHQDAVYALVGLAEGLR